MRATLGTLCSLWAILGSALPAQAKSKPRHGKAAEHVVLIVWDGMRPDFVTEENAPTLWKFAEEGVTFRDHHSVYPTLTSVNATALATGVYPSRSGPIGNYEFRPEIDPKKTVRMDNPAAVRAGDAATANKYLAVPTIAELVQASGGLTAVAGTKTAPLLFDRKPGSTASGASESITLVSGETFPDSALARITAVLGPYPPEKSPSAAQDKWTTRALTEVLWKESVPKLSILWMGDPDRSQHATAPGSATSLAAIRSVDSNLALVLQALKQKHLRKNTDVLVVSDHGFSTIDHPLAVTAEMAKAGFEVASDTAPRAGEIRVAGNGGTILFYVGEHDAAVTARLVEWLQHSDFAGVIFSRADVEGTFPLSQVHLENGLADVVLACRWSDRRSENGVAGMVSMNGTGESKGTHGTLSRFDVHNVLFAAGPDFRRGWQDDLPSSNLDVAPTVLHLLGIPAEPTVDGRVLTEALVGGVQPRMGKQDTLKATRGAWRQYLKTSSVDASIYLDEGNRGDAP